MEATAVTGRVDTPITAGIVVIVALLGLVAFNRIIVSIK